MNTDKGNSTLVELTVKERGAYKLELYCRVPSQEDLAQISMTLYQDKQILKTISLTGADKEWVKQEIKMRPAFLNTGFLKFYFGQGGMELKEAKVILVESWEEKIKEMMSKM